MTNPGSSDDDPSSRSTSDALRTVREEETQFRFSREVYYAIGLWVIVGVGMQISLFWVRRPNDFWGFTAMLTVFFHAPNLFFFWWVERIRVFADERGLRFRGVGRTRFVAWDAVEDFGWVLPPSNQQSSGQQAVLVVNGRQRKLSRNLLPFDALRELIAERATSAKTREWQLIGTRDCDSWPQTFQVRDESGWKLVALYLSFSISLAALMFLKAATYGFAPLVANIAQTWNGLSLLGRIGFVASLWLAPGLMPMLILARYPALKARRRFVGQSVVASREGLEFWSEATRLFLAWKEIEDFYTEALPGHLQTPLCVVLGRGTRFEFPSSVQNGRLLQAMVAVRALNSLTRDWKARSGHDEDDLKGEVALWPSGVVGVGPKRYHYRTRTNRAMMMFCGALTLPFPFFFVYGRIVQGTLHPPDFTERLMDVLLGVPCLLAFLGALLGWFRSWVETDDLELRHNSFWGRRTLKWSDIRRVVFNGYFLEIKSDGATVRLGLVADFAHLVEEIERKSGVKSERTRDFKIDA